MSKPGAPRQGAETPLKEIDELLDCEAACRMIERSVPRLRSRPACTGTVTVRRGSCGHVSTWSLPTIRSTTNPARINARMTCLPLTTGKPPPLMVMRLR